MKLAEAKHLSGLAGECDARQRHFVYCAVLCWLIDVLPNPVIVESTAKCGEGPAASVQQPAPNDASLTVSGTKVIPKDDFAVVSAAMFGQRIFADPILSDWGAKGTEPWTCVRHGCRRQVCSVWKLEMG